MCCCSYLWREIRTEEEDHSSVRMDIELLEEQYSSIREKQRRQTQLICFKTAQSDEEISVINVAPVCQIERSPPRAAPEALCERVMDSESGLWRSHLDLHRVKHTPEEASRSSSDTHHLKEPGPRKDSAPAVLSRQTSFGSYRSTPAGAKYYPFPQRKSLNKSETARRLGLYASL